ncbi:hypothetical protein [Variovorax sp. UC74_104]|uniref:hypothetical protein n=1 Tax=Variovorax sp. UC74_104 TaxID=3374555 RepID=UPI0037570D15
MTRNTRPIISGVAEAASGSSPPPPISFQSRSASARRSTRSSSGKTWLVATTIAISPNT